MKAELFQRIRLQLFCRSIFGKRKDDVVYYFGHPAILAAVKGQTRFAECFLGAAHEFDVFFRRVL